MRMESSSQQKILQRKISLLKRKISRLRDLKIISEDETLRILKRADLVKIKAEMYNLLVKKDLGLGIKMMIAIRDFESENNEESQEDNGYNLKHTLQNGKKENPFENTLIIKTLFGFLSLTDIKSFRLVSKNWNATAGRFLRKRATIVFCRSSLHNPAIFTEIFSGSLTTLPFTSFRFKNDWPVSDLMNFFEERKRDIEEIYFEDLSLMKEHSKLLQSYDISHLIQGSPIRKLKIGGKDTGDRDLKTRLKISLHSLSSVKFLSLKYCQLVVNQDCKVTPWKLKLSWITFYQDRDLKEICINDYFDLKEATEVSITSNWQDPETKITFDFADFFNIEVLKLDNVQGRNWARNNPNSKVNKLYLENVDFTVKTTMKITEINFSSGVFELCALPPQLEKLIFCKLGGDRDVQICCMEPTKFPNLNFLKFTTNFSLMSNLSFLSHFGKSSNLANINIKNGLDSNPQPYDFISNLIWIPRSVKRFKITGLVTIAICGERQLILDTLVLDQCNLSYAANVLTKIKPTTLIMKFHLVSKDHDLLLRFLQQFKSLEQIFIGHFDWNEVQYEGSRLSSYVNEKARYYLFQNQEGIAIDENYFQKLANFGETNY